MNSCSRSSTTSTSSFPPCTHFHSFGEDKSLEQRRRRIGSMRHTARCEVLGHEAFVVHKAHSVLLDRIPATENVQAAWILLLFCAAAKANFLLSTVNPDAHHDSCCWQCLCRILRAPDNPTRKMIAAVPLSEGGLGLHSVVLTRSAAHWASWADCIHMTDTPQSVGAS